MPGWLLPIAGVWTGVLAGFFAWLGLVRCRDLPAARACGGVAASLLVASAGFLIWSQGG